ncbi:MAG: rRNA pseudouridine synthase [Acidobacteriia bacterium]|nr:rRNA pseudouridine synthase [Terriglobia bacterium]
MQSEERLQKIIAAAGITSRRKAELLIEAGRVSVNGQTITTPGARADVHRDHIKVDGKLIRPPARKNYVLLNKPRGVMSTVADPRGRTKVTDLVKAKEKLFPVGRLDFNTEGLILLTNDGEFARIVAAAGPAFPRVYQVKVRGIPDESALGRLRTGFRLPDGTQLAPCKVRVLREDKHAWLEITLTQGKNREIRRMFEAIHHPVGKLRRTRIGFFTAEGLPVGSSRYLTPTEVARVLRLGKGKQGDK